MKVVYKKITPKVQAAIRKAHDIGREIERIELSPEEFNGLVDENRRYLSTPPYQELAVIPPVKAYQIRPGRMGWNEEVSFRTVRHLRFMGADIYDGSPS